MVVKKWTRVIWPAVVQAAMNLRVPCNSGDCWTAGEVSPPPDGLCCMELLSYKVTIAVY
jgi:hypothetical protein